MNKQIIHDALILAAFTLVLGFILALVHDITLKPIEAANLATAQAAYKEVFKDADDFKAYDYDADEADKIVADAGYSDTIDDVQQALDADGNDLVIY